MNIEKLKDDDLVTHRYPGLSVKSVLEIHYLIADFFYSKGDGIGGAGTKSMSLLQSAVDRQYVSSGREWKWRSSYEVAATIMFGVIRNHPFHDANKRTSLISAANIMLQDNVALTASESSLVRFTEKVASHELVTFRRFKEMKKKGYPDPEVRFIAWYLRRNSRKLTRTSHSITFRELATTLARYGYEMKDPHGNTIDVYFSGSDGSTKHNPFNFGVGDRVCNLGYPGASKQVAKSDLKRLRDTLGLIPKFGIDSAAFFQDADPITNLISSYEGVLRKLADL
ncbi:type II toxin-antitoxin system death-on-curing family toxin [Roseivivax sp.]